MNQDFRVGCCSMGGGRTCLLTGRDQPKVVQPNIFWNVGLDQFWLLTNISLTLLKFVISISTTSITLNHHQLPGEAQILPPGCSVAWHLKVFEGP